LLLLAARAATAFPQATSAPLATSSAAG